MHPPPRVVGPPPCGSRGSHKRRRPSCGKGAKGADSEFDDPPPPHISGNGEAEAEAGVNDAIATATTICTLLDGIAAQMAMLMTAIVGHRTQLYGMRMALITHNQSPAMVAQPWVYELRGKMIRILMRQETLLGEIGVLRLNTKAKCETPGPVLRGPWLRDQMFVAS